MNLFAQVQDVNKTCGLVSPASILLFSRFTRLAESTVNITVPAKRKAGRTTKKLLQVNTKKKIARIKLWKATTVRRFWRPWSNHHSPDTDSLFSPGSHIVERKRNRVGPRKSPAQFSPVVCIAVAHRPIQELPCTPLRNSAIINIFRIIRGWKGFPWVSSAECESQSQADISWPEGLIWRLCNEACHFVCFQTTKITKQVESFLTINVLRRLTRFLNLSDVRRRRTTGS